MSTQQDLRTTGTIAEIQHQLAMRDMKATLSTLWVVVLLNVIFKDLHDFLRPGAIEFMMSGTVTDAILLSTGIGLSTFVAMVALSRILPYRLNRWVNIIVASIFILSLLTIARPLDLDDTWYWVVKLVTLALIIASAWRWSNSFAKD